jgi:hypothetical protein
MRTALKCIVLNTCTILAGINNSFHFSYLYMPVAQLTHLFKN